MHSSSGPVPVDATGLQSWVIRRATLEEIVDLRHAVLRAGLPRESAVFEGDEQPDSRHYAAVASGQIRGCATVHLNAWAGRPAWQLRGMATDPSARRVGVGRALLMFLEADLLGDASGVRQLWCNARTPAVPFYERMGWAVVSEVFVIPTAGPHVRMTRRI